MCACEKSLQTWWECIKLIPLSMILLIANGFWGIHKTGESYHPRTAAFHGNAASLQVGEQNQ